MTRTQTGRHGAMVLPHHEPPGGDPTETTNPRQRHGAVCSTGTPEPLEPPEDPLAAARGIVFALAITLVAIVAICALIAAAMLLPTPAVLAGGLLAITWLLTGQVRG